MNVTLTMFVGR